MSDEEEAYPIVQPTVREIQPINTRVSESPGGHVSMFLIEGQRYGQIGVATSSYEVTQAMRDAFEIFITLPNCITLILMVRDEDVIGDIKALIARTTRFDIRDMYLTYCSKILDDRYTVGGNMITRMSTLGTFMRLSGGTNKRGRDVERPSDYDTGSDSETLKGTAVIKYPRPSPIDPAGTAKTVPANVIMNEPTVTGEFLNAPANIQPHPNPAEPAETNPLTHEEKADESKIEYPVKYVSKFNPRIYMNKRRAVRDTGGKRYMSMGVQSDYLPILTYSSPVDPVDPVDVYVPTLKRSSGRVAREYVPGTGNFFSRSIGRYKFESNLTVPPLKT